MRCSSNANQVADFARRFCFKSFKCLTQPCFTCQLISVSILMMRPLPFGLLLILSIRWEHTLIPGLYLKYVYSTVKSDQSPSEAVVEQYNDYPYPPYDDKDWISDTDYYILQTDCHRGICKRLHRSVAFPRFYYFTLALDVINKYLFKVISSF